MSWQFNLATSTKDALVGTPLRQPMGSTAAQQATASTTPMSAASHQQHQQPNTDFVQHLHNQISLPMNHAAVRQNTTPIGSGLYQAHQQEQHHQQHNHGHFLASSMDNATANQEAPWSTYYTPFNDYGNHQLNYQNNNNNTTATNSNNNTTSNNNINNNTSNNNINTINHLLDNVSGIAATSAPTSTNTRQHFSQASNVVHQQQFQPMRGMMDNVRLQQQQQHQTNPCEIFGFSNSSAPRQPRHRGKSPFFNSGLENDSSNNPTLDINMNHESTERYSRKVFVGGLPPDIDEEEITASFRRFGPLVVDWPHKAESKSYFPPKGYAFLLFQEEASVQTLIDACLQEDDKLYLCVSSPTIKDKPVQIRPWRLSDADFVLDATLALDPRKTVFVGGVPRPLKASELANIMNNLYGCVCYAGIDTDPELKYPKGAGRVAFSNQQSYIAAISARFVQLHHSEIEKRVEVKPYVLDDQICDECQGARCGNKFAPFFCANVTCLQYYCENCWTTIHSQQGREFHKPLVKEGADRPRGMLPFRWG